MGHISAFFLLGWWAPLGLDAQSGSISGRLLAADGPLPYASVAVKEPQWGVSPDKQGGLIGQ